MQKPSLIKFQTLFFLFLTLFEHFICWIWLWSIAVHKKFEMPLLSSTTECFQFRRPDILFPMKWNKLCCLLYSKKWHKQSQNLVLGKTFVWFLAKYSAHNCLNYRQVDQLCRRCVRSLNRKQERKEKKAAFSNFQHFGSVWLLLKLKGTEKIAKVMLNSKKRKTMSGVSKKKKTNIQQSE